MGEAARSVITSRVFSVPALLGAIAFIFFGWVTPQSADAGVPLPIVLNLDSYSISHDQHLSASGPMGVLANDENLPVGYIAVIVSPPMHGTLGTFDDAGNFEYDPPADFVGQDTFLYTVVPSQQALNSGQITAAGDPLPLGVVEINMTNSPALAFDDAYTMEHDTVLNVPAPGLLTNDFDPDVDPIAVFDLFVGPANGSATVNMDGSFQYTSNPSYVGTDTFQYRVTDSIADPGGAGLGGSGATADEIGIVTITITGPPTPTPTATLEPTKEPGEPTATPTEPVVEPTATTDPDNTGGVTDLPDTGTGPSGGSNGLLWSIALMLVALCGFGLRRRFRITPRH